MKRFLEGYFALGLFSGLAIAVVLYLLFTSGADYCPNAPCSTSSTALPFPQLFEPNAAPRIPSTEGATSDPAILDLKAQESMARATNWIAWLTLATVITGAIGTGLLIWNLAETRAANFEARESNRLTALEKRPWLDFEFKGPANGQILIEENKPVAISMLAKTEIHNHGLAPATDIRFSTKCSPLNDFDWDPAKENDFEDSIAVFSAERKPVFPEKSVMLQPSLIDMSYYDKQASDWTPGVLKLFHLTITLYYKGTTGHWYHVKKVFPQKVTIKTSATPSAFGYPFQIESVFNDYS